MATVPLLARRALVLLVCAAPLLAQEGDQDARVRARVEQCLADWRAGKMQNDDQLGDALFGLGREAAPHLSRLLDAPPPDVPVGPIARAFARMGSPECLPTLGRLAASPIVASRLAAVEALGVFGREEALPLLAGALDDEDPEVAERAESELSASKLPAPRIAAVLSQRIVAGKDKGRPARVLARLGGANAHEILLRYLRSSNESQSLAALQGLWILSLPEDGLAVALQLRDTNSSAVRKEASLFLGRVKCTVAVRDLIGLLREEIPGVAANAHWALQQITGLALKQDAELWELWWERAGKKLYGPNADPKSGRPVQ